MECKEHDGAPSMSEIMPLNFERATDAAWKIRTGSLPMSVFPPGKLAFREEALRQHTTRRKD